jgi:hypothetical protein
MGDAPLTTGGEKAPITLPHVDDDLLSLARPGEREPVAVGALARQVRSRLGTPAATIEVDDPGHVEADPTRLEQLLANLPENAIEHGGGEEEQPETATDGGDDPLTVTVRGTADGFAVVDESAAGGARFEVRTDGCGVRRPTAVLLCAQPPLRGMELASLGRELSPSGARKLRFLAVQLVGAVAVVHLVVGLTGLAEILANGLLGAYLTQYVFERPRTLLFTVSGVAILAGMVATARGRLARRRAYLLGMGVLATYLVGWVAWHTVLDHGLALAGGAPPGTEGPTHTHGGLLATLFSHYVEPLLTTLGAAGSGTPGSGRTLLGVVSVTLELAGLVVLGLLLRGDPTIERPDDAGLTLDRPETEREPPESD